MEDSELDDFLRLAGGDGGLVAGRGGHSDASDAAAAEPPPDMAIVSAHEAASDIGDGVEELLALAAVGGGQSVAPAFQQRSPELMAHARRNLELKRQAEQLETERTKRKKAEVQLAVVAATDPCAQSILGTRSNTNLPKEVSADLTIKLASLPRIRSAAFERVLSDRGRVLADRERCVLVAAEQWQRFGRELSACVQRSGAVVRIAVG